MVAHLGSHAAARRSIVRFAPVLARCGFGARWRRFGCRLAAWRQGLRCLEPRGFGVRRLRLRGAFDALHLRLRRLRLRLWGALDALRL